MLGTFDYQYGQAAFTPRDPLSSTQPPRNPLQPGQTTGAQSSTGTVPGNSQGFLQNFLASAGQFLGGASEKAGKTAEEVKTNLKTKYPNAGQYARGGLALAGMIPAAGTALNELQEGRALGAVTALAPAGLSAAGAALLGKGPLGTAAGLGLMGLGAILPGAAASGAESIRQKVTGEPTKGKEDEPSTQLALRGQVLNQNLDALNRSTAVQLQATKDLTSYYNQAQVQQYKAMAPELEKTKMNDFARYQTAMALQGQIQGQLGTLATAGALAQGAQQGNYGLVATALTNNPYAGATLQAPQIRFG
jgi:hypothetical protein